MTGDGRAPGDATFVRDMLAREAEAFLGRDGGDRQALRAADAEQPSPDVRLWRGLADREWLAAAVPESRGGGGLGFAEEAILLERFGRALLPAPFFAAVALARPALEHDDEALGALVAGDLVPTLAWAEAGGPGGLADWARTECAATLDGEADDGHGDGHRDGEEDGEEDGDRWRLSGRKELVVDAQLCTHAVVLARAPDGVAAFLVALDADGVATVASPALDGTRRYARLELAGARARQLVAPPLLEATMAATRVRAHAAAAYEALGVAERALALAVEHARTREQFGRPIGYFQAVAHPLAQRYVDVTLARALADCAARAIDASAGGPAGRALALAAKATAAEAAVAACETAIQTFGATGFTWDSPLHRLLRRAKWLETFDGPPSAQRAELAALLLARDPAAAPLPTVELYDGPEEAVFREGVRAWVDANAPAGHDGLDLIADTARMDADAARWSQQMAASGHLHSWWPPEHGGRGELPIRAAIFREEAVRRHPRPDTASTGLDLVASMLLHYGTEEQRARYLPRIADESEIWAQGFSEPAAGSDLAAIAMRAVRDGDEWVLDGTKIWSTYGPVADRYFLLARTDPESKRHRGLSCFVVDVDLPGVTIQPIKAMSGDSEFCQAFFDGVRVPADGLLGPEGEGWRIAVATLAFERLTNVSEQVGDVEFMLDRLLDTVTAGVAGAAAAPEALVRDRVARIWCALQAIKLTEYRSLLALKAADVPPAESSIVKLVLSELAQDVTSLGLEVLGPHGHVLGGEGSPADFWSYRYLDMRAITIYSGTSEILRGVIAEHVLGLPRER
jgi:alkylation response protein AidB-like acyl-CoA dehydrogenase